MSEKLFRPADLGPIRLRNRIIKAATYETLAAGGLVTDALIDWHREVAEGGAAMTTLAYCSVSADGRTFADQIWMRDEALPGLQRFTAAMRDAGACTAVQLSHAGWFAVPRVTGQRPLGPSATFSPHGQTFSRAMTTSDLERVTEDFARAARLAVAADFDALEIHMGHGYLLSQFLSPYNNRRRDEWGGSLVQRARFPRQVIQAVRGEVGRKVAVYAKLNMNDGFRGGLTLAEGVEVARLLEEDGYLDALQLTGGHTTRSPMFLMRGVTPRRQLFEGYSNLLQRWVYRAAARVLIRDYPFEEAFFLREARRFRSAVRLPLMLLGGVNRLETMTKAVAEGFDWMALGRALIRRPDLVRRMMAGEALDSDCNHCNLCMARVGFEPTRCALREGES